MKKVISLLITALVIFTLSACGNDNTNSNSTDIKTDNNSSVIKTGNKNSEKIISQSDTVVVPNVVGMNKDEAIKKLEDLGLKVENKKVFYQKKADTLEPYSNNQVTEQDIKTGTVCKSEGTTINLTYNVNEDGYNYEILKDNTIKLTFVSLGKKTNNAFIIPKIYDNYKVSQIDEFVLTTLCAHYMEENANGIVFKIPKDVKIIGDAPIKCTLVYY